MSETGQNVEASSEKQTGKKGNGSKIIIIILLVVLLIAAGIIIYLLTRTEEEPEVMDNRGTVITEDNASDVIIDQEIDDIGAGKKFMFCGSTANNQMMLMWQMTHQIKELFILT